MKMAWMKRLTLMTALASLTSGCIMYRLEELRNTTPAGTPFQNELARLYMDFAAGEEKQYDWASSWHFADKGLMLAYGKDMGPEELKDWNIPAEALPEMETARARLMQVLTADLMRASPSRAADAQFYFDCWVEQQEENWQEEDIAHCRDALFKTLDDINSSGSARHTKKAAVSKPAAKKVVKEDASSDEVVASKEKTKEKVKEKTKEVEKVPETTSYAVFFEAGKAEVSEPGMNVITEVIKSLQETADYDIILHSSKDHPGMAAERIQVIKKLLAAGGVKETTIKIASGKADVDTGKPGRRRVEIFLNE